MNSVNKFLQKLGEETYQVVQEEETKNLAKEDALSLIAEFVKDVKKKFSKKEDRTEILRSAAKTLDFYIDEIEEEDYNNDFESGSADTSVDFETDTDTSDIEPESTEEEV